MNNITNKDQIIDYETIVAGANELKKLAETFKTCGQRIKEAGDICDMYALSINGKTYQSTIYEVSDQANKACKNMNSCAESIINSAKELYEKQTNEYNAYLESIKAGDN